MRARPGRDQPGPRPSYRPDAPATTAVVFVSIRSEITTSRPLLESLSQTKTLCNCIHLKSVSIDWRACNRCQYKTYTQTVIKRIIILYSCSSYERKFAAVQLISNSELSHARSPTLLGPAQMRCFYRNKF